MRSDWIYDLYTEELASLFLRRPPRVAAHEAERIAALLELPAEGGRVFDQCCGNGALSLPLARLGHEVVGVDLIKGYIEEATELAEAEELEASFFEGDARSFQPTLSAPSTSVEGSSHDAFHGAFNWWTSFGHCGDEGDLNMLKRSFEALASGGRFALDYMNLPQVLGAFQPAHALHGTARGEPLTLLRETRLDLTGGWMHKRWTYVSEQQPARVVESEVRMYMPWEVMKMMRAVGFQDVTCYGGLGVRGSGGELLTAQSARLICVGVKP